MKVIVDIIIPSPSEGKRYISVLLAFNKSYEASSFKLEREFIAIDREVSESDRQFLLTDSRFMGLFVEGHNIGQWEAHDSLHPIDTTKMLMIPFHISSPIEGRRLIGILSKFWANAKCFHLQRKAIYFDVATFNSLHQDEIPSVDKMSIYLTAYINAEWDYEFREVK